MNQSEKAKKNWKPILAVLIVIAIVAGIAIWKKSRSASVSYREVKASRGNLDVSILATGIVQPENRLEIKAPIAGRAESVLVEEGAAVKKGQILVWMSSTERAALLDAARARGPAELKAFEDYYKATPVLAPIQGMIIQRNIQPGQTFTTSDPVLVMSDRLTIQAQVDETDISQIHLHQGASIVLDAYPNQRFPAQVDKIAYDAKTVNNVTTYIVYVLPEKTPPFMRSGMTANVNFNLDSRKDILLLPSEAIKKRQDKSNYVLLGTAESRRKPEERTVETGLSDGKMTEITSGLSDGDSILVPQIKVGGSRTGGSNPFSPVGGGRRPRS